MCRAVRLPRRSSTGARTHLPSVAEAAPRRNAGSTLRRATSSIFIFGVFFIRFIFGIILKMPGEFKISAEDWVKGACMATAGGVAMNRLGMSEIAAFYLQSRRL